MDKNTLLNKVRKLDLPSGEYVVIGSGVLAVRGIREARDIDILASPTLFKELTEKGWRKKIFFKGVLYRQAIENDGVEVYSNTWIGKYRPRTEDILKRAEMIEGVPFTAVSDFLDFKKNLGREKDLHDVEMLEEYLVKI